jgi:hypothetical protein
VKISKRIRPGTVGGTAGVSDENQRRLNLFPINDFTYLKLYFKYVKIHTLVHFIEQIK